jgi:spore maturation protein CgeB
MYSSWEEFFDKIRYYCDHVEEADKIAECGFQKVLSGHTWTHRIAEMLKDINIS